MATKFSAAKAATSVADLKRTIVAVGTIAYPSLVEVDEQSGKYAGLFLIDPESESAQLLRDLVVDHSMAVFGKAELPPRAHNPIRSGDEPAASGDGLAFKNDAFRKMIVIRAKTQFAPACFVGPDREPCDASEIRGGDQVAVEITAYGFNNQSSGVAFSMGAIWKIADGEVRIERGAGGGGGGFAKLDTSKLNFKIAAGAKASNDDLE